jgi:hypothetical protein
LVTVELDIVKSVFSFLYLGGDLQAPCGYDIFSYSWRNIGGLYHNSTQTICETTYKKGDVILIAISLPPEVFFFKLLEC